MMHGEYKLIQNGEVVGLSKNIITTNGKKQLMEYIGQLREGWADTMAFGTGTSTPSTSNAHLDLEVYRCKASISSVDSSNNIIKLKAVIDVDADFRFTEVGIFPSQMFIDGTNVSYEKITDFSEGWGVDGTVALQKYKDDLNIYASSTAYGEFIKDGPAGLYLAAGVSSSEFEYQADLSGYPQTSQLRIGVTPNGSMTGGGGTVQMTLVVGQGTGRAFRYTFPAGSNGSYNVLATNLSSMTAVNGATTADWADISGAYVINTSTAAVLLDSVRIDKRDTADLSSTLFSRATFSPQKTKWAGVPLEVEYTVTLDL